jgi:uncharacterized membrane protein (UPF0127 family)
VAVLRNTTTGTIVATRIDPLTGFVQRCMGLLARPNPQRDEGVWLTKCGAIHTIGMRYSIDVVFVDREGFVLRICRDVRPNRLALRCRRARAVLEVGAGVLDTIDVTVGDRLELVAMVG